MSFKSIRKSWLKIFDYMACDEELSCEDFVKEGNKKKDHIFSHIERVDKWFMKNKVDEEYYALAIEENDSYTITEEIAPTLSQAIKLRDKQDNPEFFFIAHISILKA